METQAPIRLIETTLAHPIVPAAAVSVVFARMDMPPDIFECLRSLKVTGIGPDAPLEPIDQVPGTVAKWVDKVAFEEVGAEVNPLLGGVDVESYFSDLLTDTECIVIEHSPPELASLAALLKHGTGVAIGAYTGLVVGSGPLLFVTVPFGIIIVGVAAGIGSALEAGLRKKILELIAGHTRKSPSGGRSSSAARTQKPKSQSRGA